MIAAAEDVLWPGHRPKAPVAIVLPRSSQLWDTQQTNPKPHIEDATNNHLNNNTVDYMAEVFDLYLALQHANIPVDFVDEDDLSLSGLAGYRLVYLTEPNLPAASMRDILQWVRRGGTLVRSPNSGTLDEYNDPSTLFADVLGLSEAPRERTFFGSLKDLKPSGVAQDRDGLFTAVGPRSRVGSQSNGANFSLNQNGSSSGNREPPFPTLALSLGERE